jgi:hypothetical protein
MDTPLVSEYSTWQTLYRDLGGFADEGLYKAIKWSGTYPI